MNCHYLSTVMVSCALETINKINIGEQISNLVIQYLEE